MSPFTRSLSVLFTMACSQFSASCAFENKYSNEIEVKDSKMIQLSRISPIVKEFCRYGLIQMLYERYSKELYPFSGMSFNSDVGSNKSIEFVWFFGMRKMLSKLFKTMDFASNLPVDLLQLRTNLVGDNFQWNSFNSYRVLPISRSRKSSKLSSLFVNGCC